jgi:hypothetical protein
VRGVGGWWLMVGGWWLVVRKDFLFISLIKAIQKIIFTQLK